MEISGGEDGSTQQGRRFLQPRKSPSRLVMYVIGIASLALLQISRYSNPYLQQEQYKHTHTQGRQSLLGTGSLNVESPRSSLISSKINVSFLVNQNATTTEIESPPFQFPETRFTPHIIEVIHTIETTTLPVPADQSKPRSYWPEKICLSGFRFVVDLPYTAPSRIECKDNTNAYCTFFKQIFRSDSIRLPYNVSIGASFSDSNHESDRVWGNCLSSSAPIGRFTMTNFQDIRNQIEYRKTAKGYTYNQTVSWEEKQTIPVFRGKSRARNEKELKENGCENPTIEKVGHRLMAVYFSLDNPHLLDAATADRRPSETNHSCPLLISRRIPPDEYYTLYQTAVVLGGIGAAFRTGRHLSAGQAVVLQAFEFEEWFVQYMEPYVHYIPLQEDLSDLKEVMEWVRDHPKEVKTIAKQGEQFYWEYLSFDRTEEHWYELLWRLSLVAREKGPDRLKYGRGRGIWHNPIMPIAFERDGNGDWKEVNIRKELQMEDAAIERLFSPLDLMYLPGQWQGGIPMEKTKMWKTPHRGWVGI